MGKPIPDRWAPRGRAMTRRRTVTPPSARGVKPTTSRSSRVSKPEKKPSGSRRRPSMDIVEGINRWLPYVAIGRRISGTRLLAFKVPLKPSYVRRLEPRDQFTIESLLDNVPELGLVIDLTQTDRYYNKQDLLDRGVHYCKIPCPGQQIPPENLVIRFFNAIDYYLDHHPQDNTVIGVHCTHGVNRTGYMLARYLIQRLGIPVREAVMCISNARNHEIERKPYLDELERHTSLIAKDSSNKDIQFSRMRQGVTGPPQARIAPTPPPHSELWRPDKIKPPGKGPSSSSLRRSITPGRSKYNGQMMAGDSRGKEPRGDIGHKFSPGYGPEGYKEPPMNKYMGYREEMWDKEPPRVLDRSREREMRGAAGYGGRRSRSRERVLGTPPPPRRHQEDERGMGLEAMRSIYEERIRHRASPPPPHYDERPIIEEARRNYRGERPDIPVDMVDKARGFAGEYGRPPPRDRPANIEGPPYDHPDRRDRYGPSVERNRDERRSFMEYDRTRRRDERPPVSPRFRGRYSPSPPPYARGAVEPGDIAFMPNRRMEEPGRQFEPDLPVGGRRMESDMPVGGRRMNENLQRVHLGEDPHIMRGRMDDLPPMGRNRRGDEMRRSMELERPLNREMDDHFRERRDLRRSPSPGRLRPGYMENYGPRGGEVPPYDVGPHMPERYGSPMRPSGRGPSPDPAIRRRPASPPRQPWHEPARNPEPEFARMGPSDGPSYRDYVPPRREPPFRGADEPPPPGIEAEMRREIEERERRRSPPKGERKGRGSRSRHSRSKSGSRSKIRRSMSPRKPRVSMQRDTSQGRNFPPPEERGHHPEERMGGPGGWPPNVPSPSRPSGPSGPPPVGREVWVDEHPPVRSRIDDGPDCRLIINKKRSSTFPEDNEAPPPPPSRRGGGGPSREERRHIASPPVPSLNEREIEINEELRGGREAGRMKGPMDRMPRGSDRPPRGGGGPLTPRRGGPERIRSGPPDRMSRGGGRFREDPKKHVFDRLDNRRGGAHWPR